MEKTLAELNPKIRTWIGSDQVVAIIDETLKKYEIPQKKISVIPRLILHITIKKAEPQNFTQTLTEELNVSQAAAVAIADEIKEKIFLPVRKQLMDDDIDINLIKTTLPGAGIDHKPAIEYKRPELVTEKPTPVPPATEQIPAAPKTEIAPSASSGQAPSKLEEITPRPLESVIAAPVMPAAAEKIPPALSAAPAEIKPAIAGGEPAPFVLHEEKESGLQTISGAKKVAFTPMPAGAAKPAARPIAARLEIGEEAPLLAGQAASPTAKTETPKQRVVHYSEFRTPVSPFGKAQDKPFGATSGERDQTAQRETPTAPPAAPEEKPVPAPLAPPAAPQTPRPQPAAIPPAAESASAPADQVVDLAAFRKNQQVTVDKNTVDLR